MNYDKFEKCFHFSGHVMNGKRNISIFTDEQVEEFPDHIKKMIKDGVLEIN